MVKNAYRGYLLALLCAVLVPGIALAATGHGRDSLKGTTKTQGDFNLSNRFQVMIDGVPLADITSVHGLEHALDVTIRPPNHNPSVSMVIEHTYSPGDLSLYNWFKTIVGSSAERKSVSVIFYNDAGAETGRLNFTQCVPVKWEAPELDTRATAKATERLDVMCQNVRQSV